MRNANVIALGVTVCTAAAVGTADAGVVEVTQNIETSTSWSPNEGTYDLRERIIVMPGATLTIAPGTVIASSPGMDGSGGTLAVARGGKIFINGTAENPVIMTSTADVATWTGGDPTTGEWRVAANEWGNLTLMGAGLVSGSAFDGLPVMINGVSNTATPTGLNQRQMEGLDAAFPGDTTVLYGGDNDDDDSGSISYVSIRYAGDVLGIGDELNGLSLGGIGRETDINYVEIMNNVDDGIEIWGGTVNIKHFSIWNVGDDCFDVDQGWRGKAQFGLLVQGYSEIANQGSGVGDNCFETDGAEDSNAQPVTTAAIYNCTAIGQPVSGDQGTAWRDNARVQYRNCIFMDLGEQLVKFDNIDGDGGNGYGFAGTLSWADTWTTDYDYSLSLMNTANGCDEIPGGCSDYNTPAALYQSQVDGKLAEISDSVFYNNNNGSAYTEATTRGVFDPANNNETVSDSPITSIVRAAPVPVNGLVQLQVISLNPLPANAALTSVDTAPDDGFFTPAQYRGAFSSDENWLCGWTAAYAFGFTDVCPKGTPCEGDGNDDGEVNVTDLVNLINAWGTNGMGDGFNADTNNDGVVDVTDLVNTINAWGTCP